MNCKQGDLAIIVRSMAGNEGKIVRCLRFVGYVEGFVGNDRWEIDTKIISFKRVLHNTTQDSWMRPIRPTDGEDEMLRIAGKPQRMTA